MDLTLETINDNVKKIILNGRMDFAGTQEIDMKFTGHTSSANSHVIIDLSDVEFIASIGIRTLVTNAKALKLKQKKMVLVGAKDSVAKVLETAGITALIPSFVTQDEALQELNA